MMTTTLTEDVTRPITRLSTSKHTQTARKSVRLICFHHAGGGATSFNLWKRGLGSDVEVIAVEIPNRERFATLRDLVEAVNAQLGSTLDEPHIFFGHSFGAMVAYRLAAMRAAAGLRQPTALILSSFTPPHLPTSIPMVDQVDDHQLGKILSDVGGLPVELTRWPTLREKAVTLARIDLRLCATDDDADAVPLTCPIHVIGGSEDILVSESDLSQWRSRTLAEFSLQMLEGGHFHVSNRQQVRRPPAAAVRLGPRQCRVAEPTSNPGAPPASRIRVMSGAMTRTMKVSIGARASRGRCIAWKVPDHDPFAFENVCRCCLLWFGVIGDGRGRRSVRRPGHRHHMQLSAGHCGAEHGKSHPGREVLVEPVSRRHVE